MKTTLTQTRLKQMLNYDPITGLFTWRQKPSDRIVVGATASNICKRHRYVRIGLYGKRYMAHRLAWFYMTGSWPENDIDHRNGKRADNRLANLRPATKRLNNENQRRPRSDNKTGFLGVSPNQTPNAAKPFAAFIKYQGKVRNLGNFATAEQAHQAYLTAKRQHHEGCTI